MKYSYQAPLSATAQQFSEAANNIFVEAIADYHIYDSVDESCRNPYAPGTIEHLLYAKCWIDSVQWHVEDEIRNPEIDAADALLMKRRIDALNQQRTDKVEQIDDYFLREFSNASPAANARVNTESPAWVLDRLSILALKIYHMKVEVDREDASLQHVMRCNNKLAVLQEQQKDLMQSINELLQDIANGIKRMKVYRQMKMYNDESLNPVLYSSQKK